jgi:ATP-dependent RNA helicase DeaD
MITSFKELPLHPQIIAALDAQGITTPTDIQAKAIPVLLSKERVDFWGQAQTGTGKTLAFGVPLIQGIDAGDKRTTQALIVAPTRELVVQITQSLRLIAQPLGITVDSIYGGASMREQMSSLKRGIQVVVGTPGRINDHINRKTLNLSNVRTLVLDEADIMLDMGFKEEMDEILAVTPENRQIWLFSATVKPGINQIMQEHMQDTVSVSASRQAVGTSNTKGYYSLVPMRNRFTALCRFIDSNPNFYGFIFCQTKMLTAEIADQLSSAGYPANALHGDMSQGLRNAVIKKFKNKEFSILVATDVAARGIDVQDLTHVINYSLPNDPESYVHRIGRTGRAGKEGIAISFIGSKNELRYIKMIERKFKVMLNPIDVPTSQDIQKVHLQKAYEFLTGLAEQENKHVAAEMKEKIASHTKDELVKIVVALIADKFFPAGKKDDFHFANVSKDSFEHSRSGSGEQSEGSDLQEIIISLGTDDGISEEDIENFLQEEGGITRADVEKLKVIKRRTFIKLPGEIAETVMGKIKGKSVAGHKARIILAPLSEDDWALGGGRPSGRGGRRGSDRGGSRGGDRRGGSRRDGGRDRDGGREGGRSRSRY